MMDKKYGAMLAGLMVCGMLAAFAGCQTGSGETTRTGSDTTRATQTEATPTASQTGTTPVDTIAKATLDRFRTNEIRSFQGLNLDPAIGPRDNSIKGVQNIDISSYRLQIIGLVNQPVTLQYEDVLAQKSVQRLITLHCIEGWKARILW
jgi:DMSO/TMAO reductase YedYZ molybdopterin-dependent catalytic subunit